MAEHEVAILDRGAAAPSEPGQPPFREPPFPDEAHQWRADPTSPIAVGRRQAVVRRRQIVLALVGLLALAVVAAIGSNATAAWWAVLGLVAAGVGYLGLLRHVRRAMAEREFTALLGGADVDLSAWRDVGLPPAPATQGPSEDLHSVSRRSATIPAAQTGSQVWALTRFGVSVLAGWALSPLVFALTIVLGKTPQDTTGQRWLANLQAAQARLREQSLRTLAISAATTASVTAAGTVAVLTGTASASTLPASAAISAGPGLPTVTSGATYRVVAGDTLSAIAARFGTTVAALASANHLANPNLIYPGQLLTLGWASPSSTLSTSSVTSATTYRVVAGDTLGAIAARFGTTVAALASANHLANPNLIYAGQLLALGGGSPSTTPSTPAAPAAPAPARNPSPAPARDTSPAPTAVTSAGETAVRVALAQVGKPYVWAGAGPNSFDCSGLVMYAWEHAGVALPHYTVAQYDDTTRISKSQLEPGDLVFYDTGDGAQPGHVTMYIGGGEIVTADQPGTVIRVEVLDWDGVPMGYGRVR